MNKKLGIILMCGTSLVLAFLSTLFKYNKTYYIPTIYICIFLGIIAIFSIKNGALKKAITSIKTYVIAFSSAIVILLLGMSAPIQNGFLKYSTGKRISTILLMFLFYFLFTFVFLLMLESGKQAKWKESSKLTYILSFFLSYATIFFTLFKNWKLKFYPSGMTTDCFNQLDQIHGTLRLSDVHSITHTLVMKWILFFRDNFDAVILVHIILVSLVIALLVSFLTKKGLPFPIVLSLTWLFTMYNDEYITFFYPWKDTFYTICVAAITYYLIRLATESIKFRTIHSILLGISVAFCFLFRKNGIILFIAMMIYFLYMIIKKKNKYFISSICVSLICILGMNFIAYQVYNTEKCKNGFTYSVFGTGIAKVIGEGGKISPKQQAKIDELMDASLIKEWYADNFPYMTIWAQQSYFGDPEGFFEDPNNAVYNNYFVRSMGEHAGEFIKLYFSLLPSNFFLMADNVIDSTLSIWSTTNFNYNEAYISSMSMKANFMKENNFFFTHGTQFIYLLIALYYVVPKGKRKKAWLIFMPVLANTISIAISAVTNETRYLQPMYVLFIPILFAFLLLNDNKAKLNTYYEDIDEDDEDEYVDGEVDD